MKTRIVSVGCHLPQGPIEQHPFSFRPKIELNDILIINPNQTPENYGYQAGTYHGKPCLTETLSEQILADKEFWENCIFHRLMAGKNVYVFLERPEQYYIHTGEVRRIKNGSRNESFSLVSLFHTYSLLPDEVGHPLATTDLSPQLEFKDPALKLIGQRFSGEMIARAYYPANDFGGKPGFIHPTSKQVLGGTVSVSNGKIILIPALDLDRPEYLAVLDGQETWSEVAKKLVARFAKTLEETEAEFIPVSAPAITPRVQAPVVPKTVGGIENQISELTEKMDALKKEQDALLKQLENKNKLEQEPNKLLFENGVELETMLKKVFNRLLFDSAPEDSGLGQPQIADNCSWVFSTVVTNNTAIDFTSLEPLVERGKDLFLKEAQFPKLVLVANAFRDLDPPARGEFFTPQCQRFAAQNRIALLRTMDLIPVYVYLRQNPKDHKFAALCREAIQKSEGKVVKLPDPPSAKVAVLREAPRRFSTAAASFGHGKLW